MSCLNCKLVKMCHLARELALQLFLTPNLRMSSYHMMFEQRALSCKEYKGNKPKSKKQEQLTLF